MKYAMIGQTIHRAIVEIAYDNGCIFRGQTEDEVVKRGLNSIFKAFNQQELDAAEAFLGSLSEQDFEDFTIGCWSRCALSDGEIIADRVLNEAFDNL